MSSPFDIIAIITPKSGKADRVEELLTIATKAVEANEPGALRYHLQREIKGDNPSFVMLETYKDQASLEAHAKSEHYQALSRAIKDEDLLAAPIKVMFTKEAGGYASRL
ncbi:antibiotic biosynthesis monooxygenase-like protein [Cucurbitaria berberidis CBS 394.84]|uniref:Antibiotic biosynthesis monooxygenase-like protein n=1 Tax=Cucurbitaria berberidis CBS 394.84 TaxID=1168544 RepID=A0A9P4GBH3_9PLEO|nr:antibiotic biosynthesis monooxygenase-like protein [Cucurbitaria berberidis CBS 394.84]KAF1842778.1 antibiotic biosynthesis monooxygenase-like protein [Cucurbitaria berberidis CBS 394.84]